MEKKPRQAAVRQRVALLPLGFLHNPWYGSKELCFLQAEPNKNSEVSQDGIDQQSPVLPVTTIVGNQALLPLSFESSRLPTIERNAFFQHWVSVPLVFWGPPQTNGHPRGLRLSQPMKSVAENSLGLRLGARGLHLHRALGSEATDGDSGICTTVFRPVQTTFMSNLLVKPGRVTWYGLANNWCLQFPS